MISRIRESASWPTADGTVIESKVVSDSSRIRGGGYNRFYTADVRYEYLVNGRRFESKTFTFGVPHSFADSPSAQAEVAAYPPGRGVKVYYDPDDPETACLAPGNVPQVYSLLLGTAALITVIGLVMFALGLRSRRTRRN